MPVVDLGITQGEVGFNISLSQKQEQEKVTTPGTLTITVLQTLKIVHCNHSLCPDFPQSFVILYMDLLISAYDMLGNLFFKFFTYGSKTLA